MSQYSFGAGILYAKQLQDASGNTIALPTPVKFGALQDVSLDISWDTKMLHGSNQFPLAVGRGKGKISGKAKFAQLNGAALNSVIFGQTLTAGQRGVNNDTSAGTLIPATPFTLTGVTTAPSAIQFLIPSNGVFEKDLGVRNAVTGIPLTRVASAPIAGQYSVNETTGAYLFASADNVSGVRVQIDFSYTFTGSGGKSIVSNLPMGYAPSFSIDLSQNFGGKVATLSLFSCLGSKLTLATKLDDFFVPEFAFEAFADASGNVFQYSLSE